jgi:hypothetical protein
MWNLWVIGENGPLTPGASYGSPLIAYLRAGKFLIACGSRLEDLEAVPVEVFGESTLMVKDPAKSWGIATLETL